MYTFFLSLKVSWSHCGYQNGEQEKNVERLLKKIVILLLFSVSNFFPPSDRF